MLWASRVLVKVYRLKGFSCVRPFTQVWFDSNFSFTALDYTTLPVALALLDIRMSEQPAGFKKHKLHRFNVHPGAAGHSGYRPCMSRISMHDNAFPDHVPRSYNVIFLVGAMLVSQ